MTARQALPAAIPGPSSPAAPATHNDRVVTTELQASRGMHREDRGSGGGQRGRAEAPVCVDVPSGEQPDWQREPEVQRPRAPGSGEVLADGLHGVSPRPRPVVGRGQRPDHKALKASLSLAFIRRALGSHQGRPVSRGVPRSLKLSLAPPKD